MPKKIDLALSRWCFRHLVDPMGTFVQAFNLLRPKTGLIIMDGFFWEQADRPTKSYNLNVRQLLEDTKAPYLFCPFSLQHSLDRFILRRPDDKDCALPLSYKAIKKCDGHGQQIDSHRIIEFIRHDGKKHKLKMALGINGDKNLYQYLRKNKIFFCYQEPLFLQDDEILAEKDKKILLKILKKNNLDEFKNHLEKGIDINDHYENGDTLLHLAIKEKKWDFFKLILEHKPDLYLFNSKKYDPLQQAVVSDKEGHYIEELLKAGAKIISPEKYFLYKRPISLAIDKNNINAIKILLDHGANFDSYEYTKLLEKDLFTPLIEINVTFPEIKFIISTFIEDFNKWIEKGNVIAINISNQPYCFFIPKNKNSNGHFITINIHNLPEERQKILKEKFSELPYFQNYDPNMENDFDYSLKLQFKLDLN